MFDLLFYGTFFLIIFCLFLGTMRSFWRHMRMRGKIKRSLRRYKAHIQAAPSEASRQSVYEQVYTDAIQTRMPVLRRKKRARYEQRLDRELGRMTGSIFSKLWSFVSSVTKGIFAIGALFFALVFGSLTTDSYYAMDLQLSTLDPNIALAVETDFNLEDSLNELIDFFAASESSLPSFNFEDIEQQVVAAMLPPSEQQYPNDITNPEQLGQALSYHLQRFDRSFSLRYAGNMDNFPQHIDAALAWLDANDIYSARVREQMNYTYTDYGAYLDVNIKVDYDLTADQQSLVLGKVQQIIAAMPPNLTDVEKVKYINDYLVKRTVYNLNSKASPYTPYSILLHGEGVCEGYALSALLLLEAAGIEAKYISGEGIPGGAHAWNLVKLGGQWYHLDITWNDPVPDQGDRVRYDYFLLSDRAIGKDHTWDKALYPVTATSNYQY